MRLIARKTLNRFIDSPLKGSKESEGGPNRRWISWFQEVKQADWHNPTDGRESLRQREHCGLRPRSVQYQRATTTGLVVRHYYRLQIVFIKWSGLACGLRQGRCENGELWKLNHQKPTGLRIALCGAWRHSGNRRRLRREGRRTGCPRYAHRSPMSGQHYPIDMPDPV